MPTELFTHDDIYEILRAERLSADLQPLKVSDLIKIQNYFKAKKQLYKQYRETKTLRSKQQARLLVDEIETAMKAIKEVYECRERKVLYRAMFGTRTDAKLKDTTNMLQVEEDTYDVLLGLLIKNREEFFNIVKGKTELKLVEAKPEKKYSTVMFLDDLPAFIGEDLKEYGPFTKGDVATLPPGIVSFLMEQEKIEVAEEKPDESAKASKDVLPEVQQSNNAQNKADKAQG